jgi:Glycosyl-4,4'-diaponeurosporenoate acyltransferase
VRILLGNPIAMMFLSFLAGVFADSLLRRMAVYNWLSGKYLFANPRSYESMGVLWFRRFLLATPLRLFNPNIRFTKNTNLESLEKVRQHIASAEIGHWVGFVTMLGLMMVAWWNYGSKVGLGYLVLNILGNLYPCLLQQYNKRRLGQVIDVLERRQSRRMAT